MNRASQILNVMERIHRISIRVAIVHEWLTVWAGSERVLAEMMEMYPEADLFVLFDRLPEGQRSHLPKSPTGTSFLQRIPSVEKLYRNLLPIMPQAIESLDLSSYDLVLSSSHAVSKGVLPRPGQLHLCYCHTPPRYLWGMTEAYFSRSVTGIIKKAAASFLMTSLRQWDYIAAQRPDAFMANSRFVSERIAKVYRRASTVIYPPVDVKRFILKQSSGGGYFVTMGRLVAYKNIDRIAEAFVNFPYNLKIVGDGPERKTLARVVKGHQNIEWIPRVSDEEWAGILTGARAFVFAAEEDFGIAPVEAQAAGVPVIAWGKGGVLETVIPWAGEGDAVNGLPTDHGSDSSSFPTGVFFQEPSSQRIRDAIETFVRIEDRFDPAVCRKNAERFSREKFRERYGQFVRQQWDRWRSSGDEDSFSPLSGFSGISGNDGNERRS